MTQTWSTASSSMCWVSSINSSTSRNISFRLTEPRSRASRKLAELRATPPLPSNKQTDTEMSSVIPDIFPFTSFSWSLLCLLGSGAAWRTEDAQAHTAGSVLFGKCEEWCVHDQHIEFNYTENIFSFLFLKESRPEIRWILKQTRRK